MPTPRKTSFTYDLNARQQKQLRDLLGAGNYRPVFVEHAVAAAETPEFRVALYRTGRCLVQGAGAADFVSFVLEPLVLEQAALGYEDVLNPESSDPHMGVDESGKGDFFGPLVVVAAYTDPPLTRRMRDMNVRDSKRISSDRVALDLGRDLRSLLGRRHSVVQIGPRAYNRLYAKMRNVNSILAWAHARAIENLLEAVPDCPRAISDQFGSKAQVVRALMRRGRKLDLVQRHRAESDPAVAAASVIARELFLRSLKDIGQKYGVPLPKGASPAVRAAAADLARKHQPAVLLDTAKCHFKTADEVLAALQMDRSVLGEDGRATSRPHPSGGWRRPRAETDRAPDATGL